MKTRARINAYGIPGCVCQVEQTLIKIPVFRVLSVWNTLA